MATLIIKRIQVVPLSVVLILALFPKPAFADGDIATVQSSEDDVVFQYRDDSLLDTVIGDYKSFYLNKKRLSRLGIAVAVNGVLANSDADYNISEWYEDHVRSSSTDRIARQAKNLGEGKYVLPVTLLAASVGFFDKDSAVGDWGEYTTRALVTGAPAWLTLDKAIGSSAPSAGEIHTRGHWSPFNGDNAVSGHSFVGAVPFLTIARMNRDNKFIRYAAYTASTFAAWSRVNDRRHYPSQAFLGWYVAWESVDAVFENESRSQGLKVLPVISHKGAAVVLNYRW